MTAFSCAQYWVSESDVSRTVVEVSSIEPAQNMQSIVVYIALSCSTRWRGCLALLNINGSLWQLLQPGCITRRGKWVLTDVDTYIRACTSCTQSYVELAASAAGRECQQWCDRVSICVVWYASLNWVHSAAAGDELHWHCVGRCCSSPSGWWWRHVPWDYLRKILCGCQRMAKVPNAVQILPKIWTAWVGRMSVTNRRQTDERAIAYSEREREFTFAKNGRIPGLPGPDPKSGTSLASDSDLRTIFNCRRW